MLDMLHSETEQVTTAHLSGQRNKDWTYPFITFNVFLFAHKFHTHKLLVDLADLIEITSRAAPVEVIVQNGVLELALLLSELLINHVGQKRDIRVQDSHSETT